MTVITNRDQRTKVLMWKTEKELLAETVKSIFHGEARRGASQNIWFILIHKEIDTIMHAVYNYWSEIKNNLQ